MSSAALVKFNGSLIGAHVLLSFNDSPSSACADQQVTNQSLLSAAVAQAVGCWEGYLEWVLREFVSKTRVHTHRNAWTLVVQFEALVDKMASSLNTPNWDKSRTLILEITGMDPYSSWVWSPTCANPTDTKNFFDGILNVRHSFAHGFPVPADVPGVTTPGYLDSPYVTSAIECLCFFASKTDELLEHELTHRHGCRSGWN